MSDIVVSNDKARIDTERVHGWLAGSYWSPGIAREMLERAIAGSHVVGAYDSAGGQIGFARLITDYATFAWLADVWVDEAARGRGVDRAMIRHLRADPTLQGLRRWMLVTRDAHTVYAGEGFGPVTHPERLMQIYEGVLVP